MENNWDKRKISELLREEEESFEKAERMEDYKWMYYHMFRVTERVIRTLQRAQEECEEYFINFLPEKDEDE